MDVLDFREILDKSGVFFNTLKTCYKRGGRDLNVIFECPLIMPDGTHMAHLHNHSQYTLVRQGQRFHKLLSFLAKINLF